MEKEGLKSLVTQMYENLLDNINNQETADREQVIEYLRNAVEVISSISDEKMDSIEHAKSAFSNAYQEIAKKSISSYQHTNKRFEKLAQLHEETLSCYAEKMIDIPKITEKFNDIQAHILDEVKKANEIITKLSTQIEVLEKDSNLDLLTKVFNRQALSKYLTNICEQKNEYYDLHVLMLDIDDFKVINDKYGHVVGDKILIFIANILKKTLRDGDKIFRYGGEEFILILHRIDKIHCLKIASRILEIINKNNLIYKGQSINVTVSIGATIYDINDDSDEIIHKANKALYKAKKDGKNRIFMESIDGN